MKIPVDPGSTPGPRILSIYIIQRIKLYKITYTVLAMEQRQIIANENKENILRIAVISIADNDFRYPIIGPTIIAKSVKDKCKNTEVRLIDNTFEDVYKEIKNFNPNIIGFSTFTQSYPRAINFAKIIKQEIPNIKLIIGGPHITTFLESFDPIFDFGIIGEGEKSFPELIEAIRKKKPLAKIKGLVYFKNKKLIKNKVKEELSDINEIFPLDYKLLNKGYFKKKFIPEIFKFGVTMGMMTSIGCPFNCRFCSIRACWRKMRFRKISNVIEEIKDLYYNYKVRHIDLFDDLFAINKARLIEFREELKKAGLLDKISFSCQARVNTVDDEMLGLLKSLNVKTVVFGFESGSDRILKYIKKDLSLSSELNKKAVLLCKKYNLNVYGGLMIGMPEEKLEDMDKTIEFIDFAKKAGAARIWIQILIPCPATEIWDIAKSRGKINDDFYKNISNTYNKYNPLLLDIDIPLEEFIKKYDLAKKKCRYFVYKTFLRTLITNSTSIFYFLKDSQLYLKRFFNFIKQ